jgi:DNA-binding NarL/FixJ family response regulator
VLGTTDKELITTSFRELLMTTEKSITPTFFDSKGMLKAMCFPELTQKQFVVLELYATGTSQKQIEAQLSISADAIRDHIGAIKRKFGCTYTSEIRQVYLSRVIGATFDFIAFKSGAKNIDDGCYIC